jgi:hypothetical protein
MRIACIHIPQFALQSATRVDPALRGAPVAVVSGVTSSPPGGAGGSAPGVGAGPGSGGRISAAGVLHAPIVLACSRAAWAQGVRLGMTATAARGLSANLEIITADTATERETVRAIADALLGVSATVDVGGRVGAGGAHLALYCEVPAKTRGAAYGEKLLELVDALGLTARVGIADDRFTAWVAAAHAGTTIETASTAPAGAASHGGHAGHPGAAHDKGVVAVPRGGSAAFLAPRPLSLLAISPEVQHMLEALGVRTLGDFATLPAPSVARPLEADYQALARGESDATLRPYVPEAPIREEVTVSMGNVLELQDLLPAGAHAGGLSLAAAIALVAQRLALRLAGRGRGAARIEITAIGRSETREIPVTIADGAADAEELGHVITAALDAVASEHEAARDDWRLRVVVTGEVVLGAAAVLASEQPGIFAEGSARYAQSAAPAVVRAGEHGHGSPPSGRELDQRIADHRPAEPIHPLAVVLSSSGSLFSLSPPTLRAERRDAHRRTHRGKQRRSRPSGASGGQAQPRLFDRVSSKS